MLHNETPYSLEEIHNNLLMLICNILCSNSGSGESDDPNSRSEAESIDSSDESLPRQSVMRRPEPEKLSHSQTNTRKKSGSDYQPSSENEDDEVEEESKSEESNEDRERLSPIPTKSGTKKRAMFQSDSDDDTSNNGNVHITGFTKQVQQVSTNVKSFYKDNDSPEADTCFYKVSNDTNDFYGRRQATKNISYTMDSESEFEELKADIKKGKGKTERAGLRRKEVESDSDFQVI